MRTTLFHTDTGIKLHAITAEQMREVDRIAIEQTGPNLFQMMESAGRNLATLALDVLSTSWQKAKLIILAGSGGNGGGGICAARHLANRGVHVKLFLAKPEKLGDVPGFQRKVFRSADGKEIDFATLETEFADLILDALIGYGFGSGPRGIIQEAIQWANRSGAPILSLDVPSGLNPTTGETPGEFIQAEWTMTLALPKTGLTSQCTGKLFLADIGIPMQTYRKAGVRYSSPFDNRFVLPLYRSNS